MVAEEFKKHFLTILSEVAGDMVPSFWITCSSHSTARPSGSQAGSWRFPTSGSCGTSGLEPRFRLPQVQVLTTLGKASCVVEIMRSTRL
jgi:hypothetical protein